MYRTFSDWQMALAALTPQSETDTIALHLDTCSSTESSGPTDDEGGLGDDEVFEPPAMQQPKERPVSLHLEQFKPRASSGSPETDPGQIGVLEKIVRSHPIWYLPHMPRTAATHLLRAQASGVFLIRQSSKPNSMALSMRLPPGHSMDTDHYLIETTKSGVRLEGSPNLFPSLPFLLEYYCENGEEIQTKLCLAPAVMDCKSRRDLHSLALMGQDFWSSSQNHSSVPNASGSKGEFKRPQPPKEDSKVMKKSESSHAKLVSECKKPQPPARPANIPQSAVKPYANGANRPQRSESASEGSCKSGEERRSFRLKNWLFSGQNKKSPESPMGGKESKSDYFGPVCCSAASGGETPSVSHLLTQEQEAQQSGDLYFNTTPSLRRKRLHTFKPGSPDCCCEDTGSTSADTTLERIKDKSDLCDLPTNEHKFARPPLKPKPPAALRREKSDLGCSPAERPWHQGLRHESPVPALRQRSTEHSEEMLHSDKDNFRTCVQELRQRRFDGAISKLSEQHRHPEVIARKDGSPHVLRRKDGGLSHKAEHRLSAPNLPDIISPNNSNAANKWQRNNNNDLQTINEGLVTPVVRRKQFMQSVAEKERNLLRNQTGNIATDNVDDLMDSRKIREKAFGNEQPFGRRYNSERSSPRKVVSPTIQSSSTPRSDWSTSSQSEQPIQCTSSDTNYQWVAVTNEFKHKQKVAKVNPYRSTTDAAVPSTSDYAHLSELSTPRVVQDDTVSVAGTVFNEPWDSSVWENLLDLAQYGDAKDTDGYGSVVGRSESGVKWTQNNIPQTTLTQNKLWNQFSQRVPLSSDSSPPSSTLESRKSSLSREAKVSVKATVPIEPIIQQSATVSDQKCMEADKFSLGPALTPPRLRQINGRDHKDPGTRIQDYIEKLSKDSSTVFGATVQEFIKCTIDSEECDPVVVIRNIRQFLNGIKNYLVKHGEAQLHSLIEAERSKLNANEFLNIDAMLEGVMHKIVLAPLKAHLYHLLIREHTQNGSLKLLSQNLAKARHITLEQLGLDKTKCPSPSAEQMDGVRGCVRKMQHHYSPLKKLESLLSAVSLACGKSHTENQLLPNANDLVSWLVFVMCRCSVVGCELEAIYMWDLLPSQLLNATASYYLTALFSAIHCIKHSILTQHNLSQSSLLDDGVGFVRVAIPDEAGGSISYHTFPGVPQMTTAKLCRLIAHQCNVTNPEDHGLYLLVDGFETCLLSSECADSISEQLRGEHKAHMFAYKRHDAKIAWPKIATPSL